MPAVNDVNGARFAEVAVDAPTGHDRTFSYSAPPSLSLQPGHLVQVPFGPRTIQGVVFSLPRTPQVAETREILGTTDTGPLLTETQLSLARWISRHYMCPLFEAAAMMLPPGGRVRPKTYLSLSPDFGIPGVDGDEELSLTPAQRRALEYVRSKGKVDQERLIEALGQGARAALGRLVDREIIVRSIATRRPTIARKYRDYAGLAPDAPPDLPQWLPKATHRAPRQAAFLSRLLENGSPISLADARKEYGASAVNALLAKGWIHKERVAVDRDPLAGKAFSTSPPATLTPRQESVASQIRSILEGTTSHPRTVLVQGVTGSGKTEIYLDAVQHCLKLGKRAVVLVPEISLTHQTVERFAARFPGQVAVLHSGLSMGERFDQWWKIKQAQYGVVIGSRSAIFAPLPDLGLVVIDEEHEWTYKQHDATPRYHTREVALRLAELTGAAVLLGSASPDVVSYYKALQKDFRLLTLPERVVVNGKGASPSRSNAPLASVQVVDMRRELREGNRDIFSRPLLSAMDECLDAGDQMVLFLNRRGSASYTQCRSCGFSVRCRRCDIALTFHRQADRLICHYCGTRRIAPSKCPKCLSYRMSYYGVGTESVVEGASRRYPRTDILRLDRDATRGSRRLEELLSQFRAGKAQILVGTQMIAMGLHFPSVSLVGVVSADVGLNIPDYRAGERAFQLLCQVAGRAGRGPSAGKVIVQTYQPDNYAVQAAASQDFQRFYSEEMAFRREQANPPFSKLIRLLYAHTNRAISEREASRLATLLRQQQDAWGYSDVELLGPTPAYPARLRGHYRWHLVLRGPEPRRLLDKVTVPPGWVIDIDPVALT